MPELPEVETIRKDLNKELKGRKIIRLKSHTWANMLKPTPNALEKAVEGKIIKDIARRAKLLLMHLDDHGTTIAVHLKMSGQLFLRDQNHPEDRFTRVVLELDNGQELRFNDLRKFGFMKVIETRQDLEKLLSEFGPEPGTEDFNFETFKKVVGKPARPVKVVIMDQKTIAGVGNIYADEALWLAKIHPQTPANKLSDVQLKALFEAIISVIEEGIKDRGTSMQMYKDLYGEKGSHDKNLKVFRLNGQPCPRCGTTIVKTRVGGRGTHFCPSCQIQT